MCYRNDWQITFCISIAIYLHGTSKQHQSWSDKPRFQLPFWSLHARWLRTNYSSSLNLFPYLRKEMAKPSLYTEVRTKWENSYHVLNVFLYSVFLANAGFFSFQMHFNRAPPLRTACRIGPLLIIWHSGKVPKKEIGPKASSSLSEIWLDMLLKIENSLLFICCHISQ